MESQTLKDHSDYGGTRNRTEVYNLGGWCSTTKLFPHTLLFWVWGNSVGESMLIATGQG